MNALTIELESLKQTLAMENMQVSAKLNENEHIFVLFLPFYFIYYANDQNALTTKLSKNSIHVEIFVHIKYNGLIPFKDLYLKPPFQSSTL